MHSSVPIGLDPLGKASGAAVGKVEADIPQDTRRDMTMVGLLPFSSNKI